MTNLTEVQKENDRLLAIIAEKAYNTSFKELYLGTEWEVLHEKIKTSYKQFALWVLKNGPTYYP